jgi:hypothetical protein
MKGLACNLNALTPEQRQERAELAKLVQAQTQELQELPRGCAFRLPSSSALFLELAEFVHLERHCCPFFKFESLGDAFPEALPRSHRGDSVR